MGKALQAMLPRTLQIAVRAPVKHPPFDISPAALTLCAVGGEVGDDDECFSVAILTREKLSESVGLAGSIDRFRRLTSEFVKVAFRARKRVRRYIVKTCCYGYSSGSANHFSADTIGVTKPISEKLTDRTQ